MQVATEVSPSIRLGLGTCPRRILGPLKSTQIHNWFWAILTEKYYYCLVIMWSRGNMWRMTEHAGATVSFSSSHLQKQWNFRLYSCTVVACCLCVLKKLNWVHQFQISTIWKYLDIPKISCSPGISKLVTCPLISFSFYIPNLFNI